MQWQGVALVNRWAAGLVLAAFVTVTLSSGAHAEDPRAELNKLKSSQDRLNYIQAEQQKATNEYQRLSWQALQTETQLAEVEQQSTLVNSQLAVMTAQLRAVEQDLARVEADLEQTRQQHAARKSLLQTRVRAMHEQGRVNYLSVLLGANSFGDFISRLEALKTIVRQDTELIATVRTAQEALEAKQQAVTARRNELVVLKAQIETQRTALYVTLEEKRQLSRSLDLSRRRLQTLMVEFEQEEKDIQEEIAELQRQLARAAGRFQPIAPMARGTYWFSSPFGMRTHPITGVWGQHTGLDFAANAGTPIIAIEDGVVLKAESSGGYGLLVVIDHGGGVSSWYAHARKLLVGTGQEVRQGQAVAEVGSTGNSTGPHLHLEIRVNNVPQNPAEYLQ